MRFSKAQKQDISDRKAIEDAGFNFSDAVAFFKQHGIALSRHPMDGWQFTAAIGTDGVCAFWHKIVGEVSFLIDILDAPSTVLTERKTAEYRAMSRF